MIDSVLNPNRRYNVYTKSRTGGGLMQCWDALYELKSCTNEIVLFFLNGETKLGHGCCNAVDVITNDCWPAMLTSLGFTSEETNVLRGFCQSPTPGAAPSPLKL
ncbi:egg cell-secreted protein 1.3 [Capsella rubella]|uniref:egg cell-secreted protein 1.3 n=1 Tax=Capsella rubella TaxID=81985 RepID=UPI000CD55D55|nr:egg cell-secreted protein 1.3 [Capsella rubella]